jgi:pimeloyl-ACP methyl ester carboxylesterase
MSAEATQGPRSVSVSPETLDTSGYAKVNGLEMYYEIHGSGGTPLVLLHGAFSAIGTSFEHLLPGLAKRRQVIAFELQGQGHTADIDRPLSMDSMAADVVAAMQQLGVEQADFFGYSLGAGVAMRVAIANPGVVRKLVFMSAGYRKDGVHPGLWDMLGEMKPEMLFGSPFHEEYLRIAPRPGDFDRFFAKKTEMDRQTQDLPTEVLRGINVPTLTMIGDSDIITPEHAVELFRLFGGGVMGDMVGLPDAQLAILPGTTHLTIAHRPDLVVPIVTAFLDASQERR